MKKLGADEIYVDTNKLRNLKVKDETKKENKKSLLSLECFNTRFFVKKLTVLQVTRRNVHVKILAYDMEISDTREPKMVHFKASADFEHNGENLHLSFDDNNKVYFKDRKLHVEDFVLNINNSKVTINYLMDEKNHFDLLMSGDKFEIDNVRKFLNTDLFIPNGHEFVSCFKDFKGDFNFKLKITEKNVDGYLKVNKIGAKLIPVADIPLTIANGIISINSNDIALEDFRGYYGKDAKNMIKASGLIKDYMKTAQTEINVDGIIKDEFASYLSKIAGIKINVLKDAYTNFKIAFGNNTKIDILGKIKVPEGSDVLFENTSISPAKYLREFDINMNLLKDILSIENIDYHIVDKNIKNQKPLITINGKIDVSGGLVNELGFDIPEPLPSEFFNALVNQKIFRRGTLDGKMKYVNRGTPHLEGKMTLKDTFIVGQGTIVKNLTLKTENGLLKLFSEGYVRRAKYKITSDILNKIVFPITVKDIDLTFDEIDVEKVIQTFAPHPTGPQGNARPTNRPRIEVATSNISSEIFEIEQQPSYNTNNKTEESLSGEAPQINFEPNIIEIEKGSLNIGKGKFKTMTFGNLHTNINLTKEGKLNAKSNKFDLTDGTSSLNIYCDFGKQKYSIVLDADNVDTDAVATSILNLDKEISGRAKTLIELNTDETLKMNGKIKFEVNDGAIAKLGFVKYVLNIVTVFRNPIVMISPTSIYDIVNIPDGTFKKIGGTLEIKDNVIQKMMIKSSSPNLSSFIVGRINLDNMDASLRIYTKFNDSKHGLFGILRGISLNALSRSATSYIKGNTDSYYAAELSMLPELETGEKTAKVFLTKFDGDLQSANFISSLKKIK